MKVKFIRTPANLPEYREGTVRDVDDAAAAGFVAAGLAVEADPPKAKARADAGKPGDDKK